MEITEVRIKLMESAEDRLRGFCSITFDDCFVVRDLKIIEGNNGPFVAMPSRKLTSHCDKCRTKNHLRARFCNQCGNRLRSEEIAYDQDGRAKLYADIAHPINSECRELIQNRVIEAFRKEQALARRPDYVSRYDDYLDYDATAESAEPLQDASKPERPAEKESRRVTRIESGEKTARGPHHLPVKRESVPAGRDPLNLAAPAAAPVKHGFRQGRNDQRR